MQRACPFPPARALALAALSLGAPAVAAEPPQPPERLSAVAGPSADEQRFPETVSLRVQAGVGGGNVGLAVRGALAAQYWIWPWLALGGTVALQKQSKLLGSTYDSRLFAPVIELRTSPGPLYLFAFAAAGYANITYESSRLFGGDEPAEHLHGLGALLGGGVIGRVDSLEVGTNLAIDLLSNEGSEQLLRYPPLAVTINLLFGLALPLASE
ncbi:MAG: hypothetical protein RL685_5794 [Pseudomonadota bacterium]|jgi:hypothetical protein